MPDVAMGRRRFLGGLTLVALALSDIAAAERSRKFYRIGIASISPTSDIVGPEPRNPYTRAFLKGLRELDYVYGKNFVTEPRGTEGKPERYPIVAAELVGMQLDVIVAPGPALPALKRATSTIPIVMAAASDPVAQGLVQSLGYPGGNITGLSLQSAEITGKRLEILKELVPGAAQIAVLWDKGARLAWQAAEATARKRGWKLLSLEIRDAGEIESAFKAATAARCGSLLVLTGQIAYPHRQRITELAAKSRLPAIYDLRPYVEVGGLISYSADLSEIWRRAADFVDKILRGAKPSDLPIEQPTTFELAINSRTAKTLALTIPQALLVQASFIKQ
jgi:putative tryptophan/tyrosine transport system substrate-binding protein